ncbi:MAG: VWA domain-containing protein [Acidobacteria bacterium]|nr:VWA domain-containing protein [Acidobacteriota bacterium]
MKSPVNLLLALSLTLSCQPLSGQTPAQGRQQDETRIRIKTAEVALDVVVRDKKGRPVKDLTGADFEIYEDGVRQTIDSFRLVLREAGAIDKTTRAKETPATSAPTPTPAAARDKTSNPGVIALLFDRLSPDARSLARKAASVYADESLMASDFTGVFAIDMSLLTLQQYTDNPQLVKQAIEQATSRSTSTFASNNEQVRTLSERGTGLERRAESAQSAATAAGASRDSGGASSAGGEIGQASVEQAFVQMQTRLTAQCRLQGVIA